MKTMSQVTKMGDCPQTLEEARRMINEIDASFGLYRARTRSTIKDYQRELEKAQKCIREVKQSCSKIVLP